MKMIVVFIIGGILGATTGFALGIFFYPHIFLSDVVADERIESTVKLTEIAAGQFIHANPGDPIHHGTGRVTVYGNAVQLREDFAVGPGPAYHVYLVPLVEVTPQTAVEKTMYIDLGRLRAFKGSQVYKIPAGVDLKNYGNVVIWCRQFNVLISPAKLEFLRKL